MSDIDGSLNYLVEVRQFVIPLFIVLVKCQP